MFSFNSVSQEGGEPLGKDGFLLHTTVPSIQALQDTEHPWPQMLNDIHIPLNNYPSPQGRHSIPPNSHMMELESPLLYQIAHTE